MSKGRSQGKARGEEHFSLRPASQVATRAILLSAVVVRSQLEAGRKWRKAEKSRRRLLGWLDALGLRLEFEEDERALLETPVGQIDPQKAMNASWRAEGLAVLAWAMSRLDLPAYDEEVDWEEVVRSVGLMDIDIASQLLRFAMLRAAHEIASYARSITAIRWRLAEFNLGNRRMAFAEGLRLMSSVHSSANGGAWLDGLEFVDGDLAIGGKCIAEVPEREVQHCRDIVHERQIAAFWLASQDAYSRVTPHTLYWAFGLSDSQTDVRLPPEDLQKKRP